MFPACFQEQRTGRPKKTYDVTSWKKAKIRLVTNITFLSFILKNEVAERVYSFGIPSDKI